MSAAVASAVGDGVYVSIDGTEDRFDLGTPLYYVLNLLIMIYGCSYFVHLVQLQNAEIPHTYFHAGINGVLYSERYVSPFHFALIFSAGRLLIFVAVCCMVLFRKTRFNCGCGLRKYGLCTVFWSAILTVLIVMDIAGLAILGAYRAKCNGIDARSNPCNDRRWCAAAEVFARDSNQCPNTGPWAGANSALVLADTHADSDFLWHFGTTIYFVGMELVFLMLPLGLWLRSVTSNGGDESKSNLETQDAMDPSLRESKQQLMRPIGAKMLGRRMKK